MSEHQANARGMLRWLAGAYFARRHTILFYSLLFTLGAAPLLSALHVDDRLLQLFLALNLLAAVLGVGDRRFPRLLLLLLGTSLAARLAAMWLHDDALTTWSMALWTIVGLLAAAGAVRTAMRGTAVSAEHLYAALSAYLLAGVFFGVLYWAIERAWPGSIVVAGEILALGQFSPTSGMYFSFVTLATLGYGDVVPKGEVARGLATLEAVAGQLYLAVMVARLVSLYVQGPVKGTDPPNPAGLSGAEVEAAVKVNKGCDMGKAER